MYSVIGAVLSLTEILSVIPDKIAEWSLISGVL